MHTTEEGRKGMETGMNEASGTACCTEGARGAGKASEPELLARLDGVLAEYKAKPGALIPVLQIAQGIYGFLPEKVLKRIALALGKSYSEVAGVVGFYSFFSTVPRGKHLVRVCLGTACYVRGGKQVMEALKQEMGVEVGGTTPDGLFSLEVGRCFGACGLAPTIMIDEDVHQRVKPLKLREILDSYRNGAGAAKAAKPAKAARPAGTRGTAAKSAKRPARAAKKPAARGGAKKPAARTGAGRAKAPAAGRKAGVK
jgi:NADH:ubiquinone oxidoreductase subunit E